MGIHHLQIPPGFLRGQLRRQQHRHATRSEELNAAKIDDDCPATGFGDHAPQPPLQLTRRQEINFTSYGDSLRRTGTDRTREKRQRHREN